MYWRAALGMCLIALVLARCTPAAPLPTPPPVPTPTVAYMGKRWDFTVYPPPVGQPPLPPSQYSKAQAVALVAEYLQAQATSPAARMFVARVVGELRAEAWQGGVWEVGAKSHTWYVFEATTKVAPADWGARTILAQIQSLNPPR